MIVMTPYVTHRLRNLVQSVLLLGGMAAIAAVCVAAFFGPAGVVWAVLGVVGAFLIGPQIPKGYLLSLYGARPLAPHELPEAHRLLVSLARRAGLPAVPALYYVPSAVPNAFAVGSPESAAIAVSDGLLRSLSLREFAGVMAHEISHIANCDLWIMGLADVMSRVTALMSMLGQFILLVNLPLLLVGAVTVPWVVPILLIFAPTIMSLLQLALSRAREFEADLGGAQLTGDPMGLAAALVKLERRQGRFWEEILLPGRRIPDPSLLRTHPPTEQRVERLRELARKMGRPDEEPPAAPIVLPGSLIRVARPPRLRWHGLWY
jgi:heat shock protein HtpX